jgi:hypothetical protein
MTQDQNERLLRQRPQSLYSHGVVSRLLTDIPFLILVNVAVKWFGLQCRWKYNTFCAGS